MQLKNKSTGVDPRHVLVDVLGIGTKLFGGQTCLIYGLMHGIMSYFH